MENKKPELLDTYFQQIESQVQFGDTKASLLVAGDAILLATSGGLINIVSGCPGDEFAVSCMVPTVALGLATSAAVLLTLSIALSLLAARPAGIHDEPRSELFLLSYVAKLSPDSFAQRFAEAPSNDMLQQALKTIHGKARLAARKFRLLKHAVDLALASLAFMAAAVVAAVVR